MISFSIDIEPETGDKHGRETSEIWSDGNDDNKIVCLPSEAKKSRNPQTNKDDIDIIIL